jgi:hypothetical protein
MYDTQEECFKGGERHTIRVPLKTFYGSTEPDTCLSKDLSSSPVASGGKGVHFCPVVSEVSWRESYSDEEQEQKNASEMDRALCALERGEDVTVPLRQAFMLQKIQIGLPVGPGSTERERVVMELLGDSCPVTPTGSEGHVTASSLVAEADAEVVSDVPMEDEEGKAGDDVWLESSRRDSHLSSVSNASGKKSGGRKFGGFFQRFSFRGLGARVVGNNAAPKKQKKKKTESKSRGCEGEERCGASSAPQYEDVTIIPLHPPSDDKPAPDAVGVVSSKPPLPPLPPRSVGNANKPAITARRRADATGAPTMSGLQLQGHQERKTMSRIDPGPVGLLETDLDTNVSTVRTQQNGAAPSSKKARSLLNLGAAAMLLKPPSAGGNTNLIPADSRAKSMEFLLDKENQAAIQVGPQFVPYVALASRRLESIWRRYFEWPSFQQVVLTSVSRCTVLSGPVLVGVNTRVDVIMVLRE